MRFTPVSALIPALALLAACAAPPASTDDPLDDLPARQTAACRSVIAAHTGRPEAEVSARFLSETGGIARIETLDGSRRHLCAVDAAGRVLSYSHPPGEAH